MKKLFLFALLMNQVAFATTGLDCKSIDGTLELSTVEAIDTGDNVISVNIKAPFVSNKNDLIFSKIKGEVNVNSDSGSTVYMGANSKKQSFTLLLDNDVKEGVKVSTLFLKANGEIFTETLSCSNNDN